MAEANCSSSSDPPQRITEDLRSFYAKHGVDVDRLIKKSDEEDGEANLCFASRFIRLNPRVDSQETLTLLKKELAALGSSSRGSSNPTYEPVPVPWLDERLGFYALPGKFQLSQSNCYKEGRIYGMDVSSGAAVAALLSNQYDKDKQNEANPCHRVLDLCCAPGLKLCALSDYLATCNSTAENAVVVGVDVSEHRIATTKRILHKYRMQTTETSAETSATTDDKDPVRIRLYCGDGTTFDQPNPDNMPNLVFDSQAAKEESAVNGKRKRMNKSAKARERKRLKSLATIDFYQQQEEGEASMNSNSPQQEPPGQGNEPSAVPSPAATPTNNSWIARPFDCILVDAECSTDGSLKHIQKQINATAENTTVAPLLMDSQKLQDLVQLQKKLAAAGFRMLKPGGSMVYSTCSLSQDQNENVVQWLLKEFAETAFLIPLDFTSAMQTTGDDPSNPNIKQGQWGVRFEPNLPTATTSAVVKFFGGGFFLAKIGKRG